MKSNLLYSVVNHLSSSNIILLLCSNKRSEANVHLRISNGVKHPHILFTLLSSCLFLSFLYLSDGIFFIFVKHPHILFPLLSSRLFLHPCRHQKSEKLHFPSSTFYILLNLYIYIFSDLPFTSATLCEGGANFRHFHRLKALSMNCIMDKFQYGGLRFRILHCLMNFLHFLPKRFCSNPVADFRVPRKIKYISVSFEL